jgi:hypothetical protein
MKFEPQMDDAERLAFVSTCELAQGTHSLAGRVVTMNAPMARLTEAPLAPAQAAVAGGNLLAFTEGVSRQNKEDVMDSFLFATLSANKSFNPETESQLWYGQFNKVLATLGWLSSSWAYSRYRSTQQRFTMDQAGLEILGSAIAAAALPGPASAAMLKVAADAIKALAAKEEPLRLFERKAKMHRGANFRIGACAQSSDGTVSLAMGAVNFLAESNVTNVLFWEWNSTNVQTWRGENSLVLNSGLYARLRELIKQRLDENAEAAIMEFDI